jgi:hypothetical protein
MTEKGLRYDELEEVQISELQSLLLIQAFDGRPIRVCKNPYIPSGGLLLNLAHENGQHHCDFILLSEELAMLVENFTGFKKAVAEPMIRNLDGAAYPKRQERLMPTYKRVAELMCASRAK